MKGGCIRRLPNAQILGFESKKLPFSKKQNSLVGQLSIDKLNIRGFMYNGQIYLILNLKHNVIGHLKKTKD